MRTAEEGHGEIMLLLLHAKAGLDIQSKQVGRSSWNSSKHQAILTLMLVFCGGELPLNLLNSTRYTHSLARLSDLCFACSCLVVFDLALAARAGLYSLG